MTHLPAGDKLIQYRGDYGVILADPPWSYASWKNKKSRTADSKYSTMDLQEIMDMRPMIDQLAAKDCALLMWVTSPLLVEGIATMEAWGFKYVTIGMNWVKTCKHDKGKVAMGMGHYTRPGSEICLLGKRGKIPVDDKGVHQVIVEPRRKHSQKPEGQYSRIELLYPDVPKIELFARKPREGWDSWGNELETTKEPCFEGSPLGRDLV